MGKRMRNEKVEIANQDVSRIADPLIFISHDSRDTKLAKAFSNLLEGVSAGMIKTWYSSDKENGGIDFGDEWYRKLMAELQKTSDVVCLFTERSLDRPWLLFEAGVAKGKLETPVFGVALGIPLSRVSAGPFYQFQNMDDGEEDLRKLLNQLAKRIPTLKLIENVVDSQINLFKEESEKLLKELSKGETVKKSAEGTDESATAKLLEEIKSLPSRVAERIEDYTEHSKNRKRRQHHPRMIEEMMHTWGESDDPVGILMAASIIREDVPWFYELAVEIYKAVKSGDVESIKNEISRLHNFEKIIHSYFDYGLYESKESYMILREFPMILDRTLHRLIEKKSRKKPEIRVVKGE
jgi:hypothetical protein